MNLQQIEADVVIVVSVSDDYSNPDAVESLNVFPFWESTHTPTELKELAAGLALEAVERAGHGFATVSIVDFRTAPIIRES